MHINMTRFVIFSSYHQVATATGYQEEVVQILF